MSVTFGHRVTRSEVGARPGPWDYTEVPASVRRRGSPPRGHDPKSIEYLRIRREPHPFKEKSTLSPRPSNTVTATVTVVPESTRATSRAIHVTTMTPSNVNLIPLQVRPYNFLTHTTPPEQPRQ